MTRTIQLLQRIFVAIALGIFSSCGSSAQDSRYASPRLDLPFPVREPSWPTTKTVPGYPPYDHSAGASSFFSSIVMQAPPNSLEWAMYAVNPGNPTPETQSVTFVYEDSGLGGADLLGYIGIADFAAQRWRWHGPFAEAPTIPLTEDNVSPAGNVWIAVAAWNEGAIGIEEISIGIDVEGEQPYADLFTEFPRFNMEFGIPLDASGSAAAPGRTLTDYEWDLDGDDVFNEPGEEADAQGVATASVMGNNVPGERFVQVRVTDDVAAQATASMTVTFLGSSIIPVEDGFETSVGQYTSLAVIDGKPAISYYDMGNSNLKYAFSSTADGNASEDWSHITVHDSPGDVGQWTSLALVDGKPAIAYYDVTNTNLRYAYSSTAGGTLPENWTNIGVHESDDDVGRYASLELINGKPAIAYRDETAGVLKFAYSSMNDGSSGWTTLTADDTAKSGVFASLAVINGKPAVGYGVQGSVETFPSLRYAWSSELDGSSGWDSVEIEGGTFTGSFASLAEVDGRPAIAYADTSGFAALQYALSSTPEGSQQSDWNIIVIDEGGVPFYTSLVVIDGRPAISYTFSQGDSLKYAYSKTLDGAAPTDWVEFTVDDEFNFQAGFSSLALVDGAPAVSYFKYDLDDLNFARPNPDLQE